MWFWDLLCGSSSSFLGYCFIQSNLKPGMRTLCNAFQCTLPNPLVAHYVGHIWQSISLIASNAAAVLPAYWALRQKVLFIIHLDWTENHLQPFTANDDK